MHRTELAIKKILKKIKLRKNAPRKITMSKRNNIIRLVKITIIIFITIITITLIGGYYLLTHPPKYELYYNLSQQKLISCNETKIYSLSINNDSKFVYEDEININWWDIKNSKIPFELSFDSIPNGYVFTGNKNNKIQFKSNCSYTIRAGGRGIVSFNMRVWTDSKGKIYKTTHPKCGLESLNE